MMQTTDRHRRTITGPNRLAQCKDRTMEETTTNMEILSHHPMRTFTGLVNNQHFINALDRLINDDPVILFGNRQFFGNEEAIVQFLYGTP